ncbi:hypothetical protein CHS0354_022807 [Potamilus streckersoni]|uniref:Uncharacterized protein n=1 Tax=Potamilus streckersoni TaxID=2493646 RepID=A0AAE0VP24_9BIVA|nr:hypothetical protein CHS0354_022807 [Potamilus streckersoni]
MAKQCWIVVICLMFVRAVHGDEDVYRWNTCVPPIDAGTGAVDPVAMAAVSSDILCAYCQRIGDLACIRRWCARAFAFNLAAFAPVSSVTTALETYYRRPLYPTRWPYINICPPYSNYYISDSASSPIL